MKIVCLNCGRPYPEAGVPYQCQHCGSLFDDAQPLVWRGTDRRQAGIWRYFDGAELTETRISLGEGNTPLLAVEAFGRRIHLKCEYANPTGSFKDRGSAALISFLVSRGVADAFEDSSGNAGASFAAYSARAGIRASVFLPQSAWGPKRRQIERHGAQVVPVAGPRSNATLAARRAAEAGGVYASHAYLPHNLAGYATCAFELAEQLGRSPGAVIVPAGQGGLLLGMGRGFQALVAAGAIGTMPALIGVQAARCAPLAACFELGAVGLEFVTEGETAAEGVRVRSPLRAAAVLSMIRETHGRILAVDESGIMPGRDALARLGFYVEPTSAIVWQALAQSLPELSDPVVVILTGSGYKARV